MENNIKTIVDKQFEAKRKGVTFEYKLLNTDDLVVDELYQRSLDSKRVARIAGKEFDPCLVNPIKVSFRDGRYWVIDGGHTKEALKRINGNKDGLVWCQVFRGLTWNDEAWLFIEQRGDSRLVNVNDKFKAMYNSGDKFVNDIVNTAIRVGFNIDFKTTKSDNRIICLRTLARIYGSKGEGANRLERILRIVHAAWDGEKDSLNKEIFLGLNRLLSAYAEYAIDDLYLAKSLKGVSPLKIMRDGKASSDSGDNRYARQFLKIYNKGKRSDGYRLKENILDGKE